MTTSAIISFKTTTITPEIIALLKKYKPLGVIIMGYNIVDKAQLSAFCKELNTYVTFILIDQEGGAVRRLRGPEFHDAKNMRYFGKLYDENPQQATRELRWEALSVAKDLIDCHINVNCAPCLDLLYAHPDSEKHVISFYDRAFHSDPKVVSKLGYVVCQTFMVCGVIPVIKHLPGHGQSSGADPHEGVCHVKGSIDLDIKPFQHLVKAEFPVWGMTNHVIYDQLDPDNPVASSKKVVDFIRKTIGFKDLLITDAIDMKALDHMPLAEKVTRALSAGHDAVLYCGGDIDEVRIILETAYAWQCAH